MTTERVSRNLNRALHALLANDERVWLLGEDITDPYGGAFGVTAGLSTAYPDRVRSTPLSENAIVGVAGGLALCGDTVIVEVMFGDFVGLAFDPLLNLVTKSVSMYGSRIPMRVVVRCPVGGGRGYGATHSQSPQKHFLGIPHLALFELSPFHDAGEILAAALARDEPALLIEDKVLYTRRMYTDGRVDERFRYERVGDVWARAFAPAAAGPPWLLIAPGGLAHRALVAANAALDRGRPVEVLVPSRLYPFPVDDLLRLLDRPDGVAGIAVVEESTAGGTWGSEVAARLYERAWTRLRRPIELIHSADSVIPAAPHLEQAVLVTAETILARLTGDVSTVESALTSTMDESVMVVPKLNANDASYVLVEWLVPDGARVTAGQPVATVETSKATEDLVAPASGHLHWLSPPGADLAPGAALARLSPLPSEPASLASASLASASLAPASSAPLSLAPLSADPTSPGPPSSRSVSAGLAPGGATAVGRRLAPAQRRIAEVVSAAHRDIPTAFTVMRVDVTAAMARAEQLAAASGAAIGLTELLVRVVAGLHPRFPDFFATLGPDGVLTDAPAPAIAVTVDVGTGLFLPVLRDLADLADIADGLVALRMKALRGRLREQDMAGANFLLALNDTPGVVVAQPIVPPGLTAALSLPDRHQLGAATVVDLGLAYDHRVVNGAQAGAFLAAIRDDLAAT